MEHVWTEEEEEEEGWVGGAAAAPLTPLSRIHHVQRAPDPAHDQEPLGSEPPPLFLFFFLLLLLFAFSSSSPLAALQTGLLSALTPLRAQRSPKPA